MTLYLTLYSLEGRIGRLCFTVARPSYWGFRIVRKFNVWRI